MLSPTKTLQQENNSSKKQLQLKYRVQNNNINRINADNSTK